MCRREDAANGADPRKPVVQTGNWKPMKSEFRKEKFILPSPAAKGCRGRTNKHLTLSPGT
jgi:hypothetical protein